MLAGGIAWGWKHEQDDLRLDFALLEAEGYAWSHTVDEAAAMEAARKNPRWKRDLSLYIDLHQQRLFGACADADDGVALFFFPKAHAKAGVSQGSRDEPICAACKYCKRAGKVVSWELIGTINFKAQLMLDEQGDPEPMKIDRSHEQTAATLQRSADRGVTLPVR